MKKTLDVFPLSAFGFIRHWLMAGPGVSRYEGPALSDDDLRKRVLTDAPGEAPAWGELGEAGPSDSQWSLYNPGRNEFVEFSKFYHAPTQVEIWAETELQVQKSGDYAAQFWVAGAADLWVNGEWTQRVNVTRYHQSPASEPLSLRLREGVNRLQIRYQVMGLRDTRTLWGIRLDPQVDVHIQLPGVTGFRQVLDWLDGVRPCAPSRVQSEGCAPEGVKVDLGHGNEMPWPKGACDFIFPDPPADTFQVQVSCQGMLLSRCFELPGNCPAPEHHEDRRVALLESAARMGVDGQASPGLNAIAHPVLARRLLGKGDSKDGDVIREALALVNQRVDCADFILATLLRMEKLELTRAEESALLRETCLNFRYWTDEPGSDAMCFNSENHSLLFHGCQLLSGLLYPDDRFTNSGRTGKEQAEIARNRISDWLDHIEAHGYIEHNSSIYIGITMGAMLNVLDFGKDPVLTERLQKQIDYVLKNLALHYFKGGVISPQGRVYRNVLYPEASSTIHLLASVTDTVSFSSPLHPHLHSVYGLWTTFLSSSPSCKPVTNLDAICEAPVSCVSQQGGMKIHLHKTDSYVLTSVEIPEWNGSVKVESEYTPGYFGYQQHLWQASLGRGCHVFVNHPGGFFDGTLSRPGYWYGNGVTPRIRQEKDWVQAIYVIPDGEDVNAERPDFMDPNPHAIPFTHGHWPSDVFSQEICSTHWRFGLYDQGLVGLWCSEPLLPYDDVLTGREVRALGYRSAWLLICGELSAYGSLEHFAEVCQLREPRFEKESAILMMRGENPTRWGEI
ncbi:hypothetical protein P3T73_03775 [Kiritimatiellota bacterium B12222]|nr:hypothetical protein P3T73_03775 [Kiritimatiellota bacterium B12222]